MKEIICQICGFEGEVEDNGVSCPYCGSTIDGEHMDQIVKKGTGYFWEGRKSSNSEFYLTDQRFITIPLQYKGNNIKGAMTAAVLNKMAKGVQIHCIPLHEIASIGLIRQGLLGKATLMKLKNGEDFKIQMYKQKQWIEAVNQAIANLN